MSTGLETIETAVRSVEARACELLADLAADPADLIDAATALGGEFAGVVTGFLGGTQAYTDELIDEPPPADVASRRPSRAPTTSGNRATLGALLAAVSAGHRDAVGRAVPGSERPPFVWIRVLPTRRGDATVRAGWLTPAALWAIVGEARAATGAARLEIIIPLDSGDAAVERVRALCAGLAGDDLEIVVQAQGESGGAKMRWSWGAVKWRRGGEARPRASRGTSYRATWVAFGSAVEATP